MPKTTIAVDSETRAKVKRLMHKRQLNSLGEAVDFAVDEYFSRATS